MAGIYADFPDIGNPTPQNFSEQYRPRILNVNFGDGYEQRATDGLNPILRRWTVSWTVLNQAKTKLALDFLREQEGVYPFHWNAPIFQTNETGDLENEQVLVVCKDWRRANEDQPGRFLTLQAIFEEVIA